MTKLISIMAALIFVAAAGVMAADKLPLVTAEWPPYSSSEMEGKGYVVEFIREVVREMGMEADIRFYPWARTQKAIENADAFGGFPFGITPERGMKFNFSQIFLKTGTLFFYDKTILKDLKGSETVDDLKHFRVGVIRETKTLKKLQHAGFRKIIEVDSVDQIVQMLIEDRIELAALVEHSGWHNINKRDTGNVDRFGAIPFYKMEAALMISKKYPASDQLRERFNNALNVVESRGTIEKLLKKYGLPLP